MPLKKVLSTSSASGEYDLSNMLATSHPGARAFFQIGDEGDPQVITIQGRLGPEEEWSSLLVTSAPGIYEVPMFPLMQISVGDTGSDSFVYMWT